MTISTTGNVTRTYGRGKLLSVLEKEILLTRVTVINSNRFITKVVDWEFYWQPLHLLSSSELESDLDRLHCAWTNYIHSHFDPSFQRNFCYYYFVLLDRLITNFQKDDYQYVSALRAILGFECFGINNISNEEVIGAATCTLRNPCYLLAKLKMPTVLNDAQFLPIITVSDTKKPELFTHYRQYTISNDSKISISLYPITNDEKRSSGFRLLNKLAQIIRYDSDPWTDERAKILYNRMIKNIVQTLDSNDDNIVPLEFVDVGAGSGSLVSRFCQQILKESNTKKSSLKFRIWSIDLESSDPARFYKATNLRKSVDTLTYIGDDYRDLLSGSQPLPKTNGLRIAIISKLFDIFSKYSFLQLTSEEICTYLLKLPPSNFLNESLPQNCLSPNGKGPHSLVISNSRLVSQKGKAYPLLSLSEYYRSLSVLMNAESPLVSDKESYYLPLRSFSPECLVASNGKSIISSLVENCDYVVIEDADLKRQDLVNHCTQYCLDFLSVQDMTKALKLKGNYLYIVWPRKSLSPVTEGEQIW